MDKEGVVYIHNGILAIKRNEILPFVTTWVDPEGIILSEISQAEKGQMLYDFTYMWNLKDKTNEQI